MLTEPVLLPVSKRAPSSSSVGGHLCQEFLAATVDRHLIIREDNVRRAFDFFDTERTGTITVANLVDIFGSEAHAQEVLGASA